MARVIVEGLTLEQGIVSKMNKISKLLIVVLILLSGCSNTVYHHDIKRYHNAVVEEAWYGRVVSGYSPYQIKLITEEEGRIMVNCYSKKSIEFWKQIRVGEKINVLVDDNGFQSNSLIVD